MQDRIADIRIDNSHILITPKELKTKLPLTEKAEKTVLRFRKELENILDGIDNRKFIVVGPCSIHDVAAAEEYAGRLKKFSRQSSR